MIARGVIVDAVRSFLGAAAGGAVGFLVFGWAVRQGFYAMIVPGGLLGIGCSLLSRGPSAARGVVCGAAGLVLGLYTEWWHFPFRADPGLGYFLSHLDRMDAPGFKSLMIGAGALLAFWIGGDAGYRRVFRGRTGAG